MERDPHNNLSRKLRTLDLSSLQPSLHYVMLKTRAAKKSKRPIVLANTKVPVMDPYCVLYNIFAMDKTGPCLGNPSPSRLYAFWSEYVRGGFPGPDQPILAVPPASYHQYLPVTWQFDEVKYGKSSGGDSELMVCSWSSSLSRTVATACNFAFLMLPVFLSTRKSYACMVQLLLLAQSQLETGNIPDGYPEFPGQHFARGLKVLFAGCKMDLKAKRDLCQYWKRNYQSNFICEYCLASKMLIHQSYADYRTAPPLVAYLRDRSCLQSHKSSEPISRHPRMESASCTTRHDALVIPRWLRISCLWFHRQRALWGRPL